MELTRKQVIEILEKADSTVYKEPKTKTAQALEYAINSLKTDEAYQIMYEGGEIFTKDDVVTMLEDLKKVIESQPTYRMAVTDSSGLFCYGYSEREPSAKDAVKHIQAKINSLKGEEE